MLDKSIIRQYDIRGIVGKTLFVENAYCIGAGFGEFVNDSLADILSSNNIHSKISNKINPRVVVGMDGRHSSPSLKQKLIQGLADSNCIVIDIGLVPTPQLYFAVYHMQADAGIMITGSHNAANYNGFKMMLKNRPVFGDDIRRIANLAKKHEQPNLIDGELKPKQKASIQNVNAHYVRRIFDDINIQKPLKIVFDCGNGACGNVMQQVCSILRAKYNCEAVLMYAEIDGNFPNHHPDPTVEENLRHLRLKVRNTNADIGIAFDGDGDRIGIVDNAGNILWGDQIMCILSEELLKTAPGAKIVYDVKASLALKQHIEKFGGIPVMYKTGHSLIKSKMIEEDALLAGEMSGHIFYGHKYYGFDDAIYAALRFLEILSKRSARLSEIFESLPKFYSTPEIRMDIEESSKFSIIDRIVETLKSQGTQFNDIDGVRVEDENGWWLIRASNTQNCLSIRCEALTQELLNQKKLHVKNVLKSLSLECKEL